MEEYKNIINEAKKALSSIQKGKTYTSEYLVSCLVQASEKYPQDQLINNMRDIFIKKSAQQLFFTQKDVGDLYKDMYGLSGNLTGFRQELEDLLPESLKFAEIKHQGSQTRTNEEAFIEPLYKDSTLSNAFSSLFSLGNKSKENLIASDIDIRAIEQAVSGKLSKLGKSPVEVKLTTQNEHFILCTAIYQDRKHNKLSIQIPVQVNNGKVFEPELMILGSETIPLTQENLYIRLKEFTHYKQASIQARVSGDSGLPSIENDRPVLPTTLEHLANFDTNLIQAAQNYKPEQIILGANLVNTELSGLTNIKSQIKVSSSNKNTITFTAEVPSKLGLSKILIPVEYHNGKPILPSKFATSGNNDKVYDFSKDGFRKFFSEVNTGNIVKSVSRENEMMSRMSYHQLVDQMIEGVANKDYVLAEDALSTISSRFDDELSKKAFGKYTELLRCSSTISDKRKDLIKEAQKRGDLITIPTTVELYNPRLGLPLSKIDFDLDGKMYPKGRMPKYDNLNSEINLISTSKIVLN